MLRMKMGIFLVNQTAHVEKINKLLAMIRNACTWLKLLVWPDLYPIAVRFGTGLGRSTLIFGWHLLRHWQPYNGVPAQGLSIYINELFALLDISHTEESDR